MFKRNVIKNGGIPMGVTFQETGKISANAYANVFEKEIDFARYNEISAIMKNTHATASITYSILAYSVLIGPVVPVTLVGDTALAAGVTSELINLSGTIYAKILIQIKSTVSDTHGTVACEAIMRSR